MRTTIKISNETAAQDYIIKHKYKLYLKIHDFNIIQFIP